MKYFSKFLFIAALLLTSFSNVHAQRAMEKLDRSIMAQKVANGVYVNWRIPANEYQNVSYRLYRDGSLIHETGVKGASNFTDNGGTTSSKYTVTTWVDGVESAPSKEYGVYANGWFDIPLRNLRAQGKYGYFPNDATAADLDGDGEMEIIVKRLNKDYSVSNTNYSYFEAYKMDGTFLWAIDLGPNIVDDVNTSLGAFDFDGDGAAEVFVRTSEGTVFGDGTSIGDTDGDGKTNYRYSIVTQYMCEGPEFLSLVDGKTGAELDRVNWIPRGNVCDWGDCYGHRASKYFFGAPYLDGIKPSIFIGRGIYTRIVMQTYDVVNKKLQARWNWDSNNYSGSWAGQGYHNYVIADLDGDGKDEVNFGSMAIDDDGKGLYTSGLGHGDAQHVSDLDPYRKGVEVFACNETSPGTNMRDAKTGQILFRLIRPSDVGRAGAGNISEQFKGAEIWGGGVGSSATDRQVIQHFGVAENYCVYWDGDLLQEILDHRGFSSSTGVGYGTITKFNGYGNIQTLLESPGYSNNWSKGTPTLQADILGDWREEAIWWRTDSMALRVHFTNYPTQHRIYTLLHDHQYRQAVCWQMCEYNQPPHTSFYLGSEFPTPIPPKATNGKMVWNGATADWNAANWLNGDDAEGLIAGTAVAGSLMDNKEVLLDRRAAIKDITVSQSITPKRITMAGTSDYTISGTGSISGATSLVKMGESSLTITGTHDYTGVSEVWEGNLWIDGSLSGSELIIRRHANFGGKASLGKSILTEYNAGIYPGGMNAIDTLRVAGDVNLVEGALLQVDLSDLPANGSDLLEIQGKLTVADKSRIVIRKMATALLPGSFPIVKVDTIIGNISKLIVEGATGVATELAYDGSVLSLVVKGVRSASSVEWNGDKSNTWDLATTTNWERDGMEEIFVTSDTVVFNDSAYNKNVLIPAEVMPAQMIFDANATFNLSGEGAIAGSTGIVKKGNGNLIINNRNSFTGKTLVEGGKLTIRYTPSPTMNGSLGANTALSASLLELKDSAILSVLTAGEITDKGMTVSGNAGGLIENSGDLYWNGVITGNKLSKIGTGTLFLGANNSNLSELVVRQGKVKLNSSSSVAYGPGKKLTLLGGTLETMNSTGSYLTSSHAIDVPSGVSTTFIAGARCEYNGKLTGGGLVNWYVDYIRAHMNGDWSGFTGKLNLVANGANNTYENQFRLNNSKGMPDAALVVNSGVKLCWKDENLGTTSIGMITGVEGGVVHNLNLTVGASGNSGTYAGIITGSGSLTKAGSGLWILKGANTYSGNTTLSGGIMTVMGSLASPVTTLKDGTTMNLTGTIGGSMVLEAGSTLALNGTVSGSVNNSGLIHGKGTVNGTTLLTGMSDLQPGYVAKGIITFSGAVSVRQSASITIQVKGGIDDDCDVVAVGGTLSLTGGILNVKSLGGTFAEGNSYQIFKAGAISGAFEKIEVPELPEGLGWNINELYTSGIISVHKIAVSVPTVRDLGMRLLENPTNGLFRLDLSSLSGEFTATVIDLSGRTINLTKIYGGDASALIDLQHCAAGTYTLFVRSTTGIQRFKLLKQ